MEESEVNVHIYISILKSFYTVSTIYIFTYTFVLFFYCFGHSDDEDIILMMKSCIKDAVIDPNPVYF